MVSVRRFTLSAVDIVLTSLLKFVLSLMEHLPEGAANWVARRCIDILRIFMPRSEAVGRRNLKLIFPEKDAAERREILRRSYDTLARHLVAFAKIPALTPERAAEMFDYSAIRPVWEQSRKRAPAGTGSIIVTAHFGSFERLVQAHALLDRPLAVVTRPFALPRVEKFMKKRRERFGNIQISRDGATKELLKQLRNGKDVLLVMDQNVRVHHAVFVDFFSIPAATTKMAALAALRTGAPIFFAACAETSPSKYTMLYAPIGVADDFPGSQEQKIELITRAIHAEFEKAIIAYPEEWMWIHRRYKTRPVGEREDFYGGSAVTEW